MTLEQRFLLPCMFAAAASLGHVPTARAQCLGWKSVIPPPGNRSGHAIAFDSVRHLSVLVGGSLWDGQEVTYPTDTWGWNGQTWMQLSTAGPPARTGHAMAFDSARGVVVLFGGSEINTGGADVFLGETWEWDGLSWTLRSTNGPSPRAGHRLAYDSTRGVTMLFGGTSGGLSHRDLWEWDGTNWTLRNLAGPRRERHAMAFDSVQNTLLVHGGVLFNGDTSADQSDTWEWNGSIWNLRGTGAKLKGPVPRMAYDAARGAIVLVGVYNNCRPVSGCILVPGTFEWNGSEWVQRASTGPMLQWGFDVAFDSLRSIVFLFGSADDVQMWEWNGSTWNSAIRNPPPRSQPGMVYDSARGVAVVFGGQNYGQGSTQFLNDTWEWDGAEWHDRTTPGPSGRVGHAMAFDRARGVTVLFGGSTGEYLSYQRFGDTWEWDGQTWTLRDVPGPSARAGHAMSYDDARGVTVLWGGSAIQGYSNETWEWDGETWAFRTTAGPSPRAWALMAYDSVRAVNVLFWGGYWGPDPEPDTWEWDGTFWRQGPAGPQPGAGYAMAFDSARGVSVLSGGFEPHIECPWGAEGYSHTWEWNGASWTRRLIPGTPLRAYHVAAYDTLRSRYFTFGGGYCGWIDPSVVWVLDCAAPCSALSPPAGEPCSSCAPGGYASKNRYLSFSAPLPTEYDTKFALRVTLEQMPRADDCPNVGDFGAFAGTSMWVGEEVSAGGTPTAVFRLQSEPLFRDTWNSPGGVIQVADCNIIPCATYAIEAVTDAACDPNDPSAASLPLLLTTTGLWGDVVGATNSELPNGVVDFVDISACVDRFKNAAGAPPRTWCDVASNNPTQGVNFNIDFADISAVVDAFKGADYPYAGPTAPDPCP